MPWAALAPQSPDQQWRGTQYQSKYRGGKKIKKQGTPSRAGFLVSLGSVGTTAHLTTGHVILSIYMCLSHFYSYITCISYSRHSSPALLGLDFTNTVSLPGFHQSASRQSNRQAWHDNPYLLTQAHIQDTEEAGQIRGERQRRRKARLILKESRPLISNPTWAPQGLCSH